MLQVRRYPDARAVLARAEPWLLEAEVERGPVLASARQAFVKEATYEKPVYWATIEEDDQIIGCAYRTPPYRVGVTALPTAALAPLSLDLEKTYKAISGFSGATYGSPKPVKFLMSPARAFLYRPLGSRASSTSRGAST